MPYIGRDLNRGNYLKLDDISSSFNGSTKTFNLTVGGSAFTPGSAFSILVSVGGVIQEPESAYQVNNSEITFANAPTAQDSFFCIALGVALGIGVPGSGTVNGPQMAKPFNYDGYFYLDDTNNRVGIGSLIPTSALDIIGDVKVSGNITGIGGTLGGTLNGNVHGTSGISTFYDLKVTNNLTVEGTTTTLDTDLIGVDRVEVGANSNSIVGVAVTQSGTADILRLYDGTSQVVTVADGGGVTLSSTIDVTGQSTFRDRLQIVDATPEILLSKPSGGLDSRILNDGSGNLIIGNGENSDTPQERVRITSDGEVGIGTTNPENLLDLYQTSGRQRFNKYGHYIAKNNNASTTNYWTFAPRSSGNLGIGRGVPDSEGTVGVANDKLTIKSTGEVGIGTDNPVSKLDVVDTSGIISRSESTQSNHTNKALQVRNNSDTNTFSVSYRGQLFTKSVGIGTDSPSSPLHISGTDSNGTKIKLEDNNNGFAASEIYVQNGGRDLRFAAPQDMIFTKIGGSTLLYLENGQNVGIGTDNPSAKLHVFGNSIITNGISVNVSPAITIRDGTTEKGYIGFNANDPFIGRKNGVGLLFQDNKVRPVDGDDGSGTNNTVSLGEPTYKFKDLYLEGDIHIDSDVGQLRIGADEDLKIDHNGSNAYFMNGTGSTLNRAADHIFENADGSTEYVRIKSDGNVGIGTATPGTKLHISGTGAGANAVRIDTSGSAISIHDHSEFIGFIGNDSGKLFINAGGTEDTLSLRTNGTEALRISSDRNVGIGTDNPTDVLDINSSQESAVSDVYIRNHANLGGAALNLFTQGTYSSPTYKAIIGCSDAGGNIRMGAASNHELLLLTNNTPRVIITTGGVALFNGLVSQVTEDTSKLAVQGGDSNIGIIQVHSGGGENDGDLAGITFSHGIDNTTARAKGAIAFECDASGYGRGELCFYVDGGSDNNQVAAADEKLRIKSNGQLNIAGNMQFTVGNPELEFNNGGPRFRVPAANTLAIHNGGTLGSTNNEVIRIKSDGNVGIGEDNPTSKLVVEGGVVINNASLTVDKHIIDGTDDWAGASHAIHHKRSFTHNTWTNIFKFYRTTTSADNNAVGTYGGSLHISYIYDRENTVHATGYDVFPFVVRARSSNNLSGNFASQIINLEEIIGATVEVRFTNATTNQIDVQVKFFRSDEENDSPIENLVHAWIDGGGVASNSSRFLYPSILT